MINEKSIGDFKKFLIENEKSNNTVEKYLRDIHTFFLWLKGDKVFDKITVLNYKKKLCEEYAPRSVNSILSSLNAFFEFANLREMKVKTLKIQRKIFSDKARELTKAEYQKLLNAAKNDKNDQLYFLIQTIANTGIRVSEVRYITYDALKSGYAVINCKGKIRQIFLQNALRKILIKYAKKKNIKRGSIFVSKNGKPLDRSNIWKMLRRLSLVAGVAKEKVFPHNFRHLFARTFYGLQKDIVRLADILGHSSIETTRIYTVESGETHMIQLQKLGLLRY